MAKEYKEKIINVRFRRAFEKPATKKARAALFELKEAVKKETRAKEVFVSNGVNNAIWANGKFKCPRKLSVKAIKDKLDARIYLLNEKVEEKEDKSKKKTKEIKKEDKGSSKEEVKKETKDETKKAMPKEVPAKKETSDTETKEETPTKE